MQFFEKYIYKNAFKCSKIGLLIRNYITEKRALKEYLLRPGDLSGLR
jgi:hypothetical protein